jgi:hypothetical protein
MCIPSIQFFPRITETTTHFLLSWVLAPLLLPLLAHVGKASTCHIERKKGRELGESHMHGLGDCGNANDNKKRVPFNNTCSFSASIAR